MKFPEEPLRTFIEMVGEVATAVAYMAGVVVVETVLRPMVSSHGNVPFLVDWTLLGLDLTLFILVIRRLWKGLTLLFAEITESNVAKAIAQRLKSPQQQDSDTSSADKEARPLQLVRGTGEPATDGESLLPQESK